MEIVTNARVANSVESLRRLLDDVEQGRKKKPDWIALQSGCRLDRLDSLEREEIVRRIHRCALRGFRANNVELEPGRERLEYWSSIARNGFHDFSELGWMKCYDSPYVENYDYVTAYSQGGIDALDDYLLYTSVLGTLDYTVEDFVHTLLCEKVETIVEPMAGTAEFAYAGHFRHPEFRYVMFDLDEQARDHVNARRWLPDTERHYFIGDVLDEASWEKVAELSTGQSLTYIGKQSHHFFSSREFLRLLDLGTRHTDFFMLEVPEPSLMEDVDEEEDLTRPETEDAGFHVALINEPGSEPNPLTNRLSFNLEVSDASCRRKLFEYHDWTSWQHPTLVAMADILHLNAYFFHSNQAEFVDVEQNVGDSDCLENVTFMVFTRHGHPEG